MLLVLAAASYIWEPRVEQGGQEWKFECGPTGSPVSALHLV